MKLSPSLLVVGCLLLVVALSLFAYYRIEIACERVCTEKFEESWKQTVCQISCERASKLLFLLIKDGG
jgi:hypothetical protein